MIVISLTACSAKPVPIEISTAPVEKPTLTLPPVDELNMRKVEWIVINQQNIDKGIAEEDLINHMTPQQNKDLAEKISSLLTTL